MIKGISTVNCQHQGLGISNLTEKTMQSELERIRDWAKDKLQSGNEPPWAWYQYMKLVETADSMGKHDGEIVALCHRKTPAATRLNHGTRLISYPQ